MGSALTENKRIGSGVSVAIPQSQASTVGTNWFTDVTQVDTGATFPFAVRIKLRIEG